MPRHASWSWLLTLSVGVAMVLVLEYLSFQYPAASLPRYRYSHAADWASYLISIGAILFALRRFPTPAERWGWVGIAGYILLLGCGDVLWMWYVVARHTPNPFPSLADIPYTLAFIPLWIGLFLQPSQQTRDSISRLALALEMCITILAAVSLLWFFSIGPAVQGATHLEPLEKVLTVLYPLLDLATLMCVIVLLFRSPLAAFCIPRVLLALGVAIIVGADTAFSYLEYLGTYETAGALDILWPLANLLLGAAALAHVRVYDEGENLPLLTPTSLPARWHIAAPYVMVAVVSGTVLFAFLQAEHTPQRLGLLIGAVAIFFLVLVRQWLTFEENRRLYKELQGAYQDMTLLALTDGLTGLANYRTCMERLEEEVQRADRYGTPVALIFADLDHFKVMNDTYGHRAGDRVLSEVARLLRELTRTTDLVARYAGEEFIILLPQTTLEQANVLAERLCEDIAKTPVTLEDGRLVSLTISLGVSAYPDPSTTLEGLITDADAAMYRVKSAGRNGVQTARPLRDPHTEWPLPDWPTAKAECE